MYIHVFAFYIHANSEGITYKIGAKCSIGENTYRDLMLGSVMSNMGIQYKAANYQNFAKIRAALYDPHWKVGRFATRFEEITDEEISNVLRTLGCDLASIYLHKGELEFFDEFVEDP